MTVHELIEFLSAYPPDMQIVDSCGLLSKEDFKVIEEYYNGDSANPNCEILKNVLYID